MAVTPKTVAGDAVRIEDTERLDNADAAALQSLTYEHIVSAFGALVGPSSGVLSNPTFDVSNLSAVVIGECMLYDGRAVGSGRLSTGTFIPYNPADSWQSSNKTVDISSYSAGSGTPFIWAKRVQVDSESATRRKWVMGVGEDSYSPETRQRERVEWAVGTASPGADYFKVAQVASWSSGVPVIVPTHAFDLTTDAVNVFDERWTLALGVHGHVGIARALTMITETLRRHYDRNEAPGSVWTNNPTRGLKQLHEALTTTDATVLANSEAQVNPCVLYTGRVTYDPTGPTISLSGVQFGIGLANDPDVTHDADGELTVDWSENAGIWLAVHAVHLTPTVAPSGGVGTPHVTSINTALKKFEVKVYGTSSDKGFYMTIIGQFATPGA